MRRHLNQVLTDGLSPQVKGDSTLEGPEAGGSTLRLCDCAGQAGQV